MGILIYRLTWSFQVPALELRLWKFSMPRLQRVACSFYSLPAPFTLVCCQSLRFETLLHYSLSKLIHLTPETCSSHIPSSRPVSKTLCVMTGAPRSLTFLPLSLLIHSHHTSSCISSWFFSPGLCLELVKSISSAARRHSRHFPEQRIKATYDVKQFSCDVSRLSSNQNIQNLWWPRKQFLHSAPDGSDEMEKYGDNGRSQLSNRRNCRENKGRCLINGWKGEDEMVKREYHL